MPGSLSGYVGAHARDRGTLVQVGSLAEVGISALLRTFVILSVVYSGDGVGSCGV